MAQLRKARLESDLEIVRKFCSSSPLCTVLGESVNESFEVQFTNASHKMTYTINFMMSDYPDGTTLCCGSDSGDLQVLNKPLLSIFCSIFTEFCQKCGVPIPDDVPGSNDPLDRQESDASYVTASDTDDMLSGDDGYDDDEMDEDDMMTTGPHPLLEADLTRVSEKFGKPSVDYKMYPSIDEVDVFLNIDVQYILDEDTASAWGVKITEPIIVFLRFKCMSLYLDGVVPEIKVYQPSNKDTFCLGVQIGKILEVFIAKQFKELSCKLVEELVDKKHQANAAPPKTLSTAPIPPVLDEAIARVMALGFEHQQTLEALLKTNGDVGKASMMLSGTQEDDFDDDFDSYDDVIKKTPNVFLRQASSGAQAKFDDNEDSQDPKKVPSLGNGFLCQLMDYILQRIKTLNEFCVICDERHVFDCALLKPCVCTRTLCVFSFQTLGVMADAAEAIATDADVVDLLIAMANAAVCSGRKDVIFDPYPSIVDPSNPNLLALDPSNKDYERVKKILKVIISSREAAIEGRGSHLKGTMDEGHVCAFPLMQWILASNRSHIVLLPPEKRIQSMKTDYQFLLVSSPPAKEHAFQKAKTQYGSTYAFHGSSIENWHSIVRKGLLNASGTKFQMNGAAYGKGIYLSPVSSVSFGYTRSYYNPGKDTKTEQSKGLVGKTNLTCIALCEVISKDINKSGDIWVCPQEDYVCTRFFFVYERGGSNANIDTRKGEIQQEISHAVSVRRLLKATS
ncbi:protein mono-ADP-ribosyltransferase PARP6-like [Dysidea avara]|uniref:protein mono-ADP-ribosyltransferase PARP6-like n=1 Tax=Dysidea avara TaxID=196820 RepID=UPI003328F76D